MPGSESYILVPFNAGNGFKGFHVLFHIDHVRRNLPELARRIGVCLKDDNVVCDAKTTILEYVRDRAAGVQTHPLHVMYVTILAFFNSFFFSCDFFLLLSLMLMLMLLTRKECTF